MTTDDETARNNDASNLSAENIKRNQINGPWTVCVKCSTAKVHAIRNKERICKSCKEKVGRRLKKQRIHEPFGFEQGCQQALEISGMGGMTEEDKERAMCGAKLLGCQPMVISIAKKANLNEQVDITGLFNKTNLDKLHAANVGFASGTETAFTCTFRLPEAQQHLQISESKSDDDSLRNIFSRSKFPNIDTKVGPFVELDTSVTEMLNVDFRLRPELLPKVASLITSAVLVNNNDVLMILTAEVYSRHESLDIHSESDYLSSTLPEKGRTKYADIFVGTVISADGKRLKSKLIVASKTMNILSTCSCSLSKDPQVFVGPETGVSFSSAETRIFFTCAALKEMKNAFENPVGTKITISPSLSALRQVTSGFDSSSTFKMFRMTFAPFDDLLHMPATIFTICDLPSFVGYGSNHGSATRIASCLLQLFAIAALMHSGILKKESFVDFHLKFAAIEKKDSEQWRSLQTVVDALAVELEGVEGVNIFTFASKHSLSGIAGVAGSGLSTANAKVKENVTTRLRRLYLT
ncbi:hypothetical protein DFQ28_010124 [Apophysomyces sp. BC1034]|nr:hypothetical protein DFQ30_003585 [Apophysomyces sp. BC1015]KAG0179016.1 hypothetical protein DFQ29_002728 [Apophysomyces sp. BC1021]KAG0192125.1 hypothetical protein DFQ28_010124 [Apophysomyces sp. BC1034]